MSPGTLPRATALFLVAGTIVTAALVQGSVSDLWSRTPNEAAGATAASPAIIGTLRELKALGSRPAMVSVGGHTDGNDGGGGQFVWLPDDTTEADDGLVVQPADGPPGRYKRVYSGPVDVRWFGARGDGKADDTQAVQAAAAQGRSILFPPGGTFVFRDVVLGNNQLVNAQGAVLRCAPGGAYLFRLTGYGPQVHGAYVGDARNCGDATFVIDDSMMARIDGFHVINAINGIRIRSTSRGARPGARRAIISNGNVDTYTGAGLHIGGDSSDITVSNIMFDPGWFNRKPRPDSVGVKLDGTGTTTAKGGHLFTNVIAINAEVGFEYHNAELTKHDNCIADGASRYGIKITGQSQYLDFGNFFVGSTGNGIYIGGTSSHNSFTGLRTVLNGYIPPWGETKPIAGITRANPAVVRALNHGYANGDIAEISGVAGMTEVNGRQFEVANVTPDTFELKGVDSRKYGEYRSGGKASTFFKVAGKYDIVMDGTARATIDAASWVGSKDIHYASPTASLVLQGARVLPLRSIGSLPAGTTSYLTDAGQQADINDGAYVAEEHGAIVGLAMHVDRSPGAAERVIYTVLIDGRPTGVTYITQGTAFGGAYHGDPVPYAKGQSLQIRVETSAGAAPARHRGYVSTISRGG
jgi:hypothetical protein